MFCFQIMPYKYITSLPPPLFFVYFQLIAVSHAQTYGFSSILSCIMFHSLFVRVDAMDALEHPCSKVKRHLPASIFL